MAAPATRGTGCAELVAYAVNARDVILAFLFVTSGAVRRWQLALMHQVFDAFVAINAIELRVEGFVEGVSRKNQGNDVRTDRARGGRIEMAIQAVSVGELRLGGQGWLAKPTNQREGEN